VVIKKEIKFMPYIKRDERNKFDNVLEQLPVMVVKGELEYCIFKLMKQYMVDKAPRYSNLHDTTYAAAHCSDEYRRRYLDAREDEAMDTNGDV
jgi:hypothetical protein